MTAATTPGVQAAGEATATANGWPLGAVLRDISRGGLAGLIVGILVAGVGSRLMMRAAALLVPSADGAFTEQGFEVGVITLGRSIGLAVFGGALAAIVLATFWVSISPWLPGPALVKGLVAVPIAIAFGGRALVDRDNPDFVILGHEPAILAIILGLVALTAPAMALTDAWLDRRLPDAGSETSRVGTTYALLASIGAIFGGLITAGILFAPEGWPVGLTILATGGLTIAWWHRRVRGQTAKPRPMVVAARLALVAGTIASFVLLIPHLEGALGLG